MISLSRPQVLEIGGYAGFFAVMFVLFAYWTFPYERIVDRYLQQFAAERGYRVEVGDVDPYWFTGIELEDVRLYTSEEDKKGIHLVQAQARAGFFSLLSDSTDLSFSAEFAEGGLEGSFSQDEEETEIQAELDSVRLEALPMIGDAVGLPVMGTVTGEVDLTLPSDPSKSEGKVDLTVEGLQLGDGEAKLSVPGVPAFTVDPIEAGKLSLALEVAEGKAELKQLKTKGKDVELEGSGQMRLGKSLSTSRPNFSMRARFTDAYKKKTPRTEAMFSLLEGSSSSQLRRAMGEDGWMSFTMSGSLTSPRFLPGGGSGGGSRDRLRNRSPRSPRGRR